MSRANYDFIFIRRENSGVVPEYVFRIIPKRKDKHLLRGQMWIDAGTFRIYRIEGVSTASPSLWLKNIQITMQFAMLGVCRYWCPSMRSRRAASLGSTALPVWPSEPRRRNPLGQNRHTTITVRRFHAKSSKRLGNQKAACIAYQIWTARKLLS